MNNFIETERLTMQALNYEQLHKFAAFPHSLGNDLQIQIPEYAHDNELLTDIREEILPTLKIRENNYLYYTLWIIADKASKTLVGIIFFKGEPNFLGEVELGYNVFPAYRNKGIASEALNAFLKNIKHVSSVRTVIAETEHDNLASQHVLQKNNFLKATVCKNRVRWRYNNAH